MFKRILVAEDFDCINWGLSKVLEQLKADHIYHAKYCDDAFLKFKSAVLRKQPYDLLICDLSFKVDHRDEKFKSGQDLIIALRKIQPELKTIIFTVEDYAPTVQKILKTICPNGYVCKGRTGLTELDKAIDKVYNGNTYFSPQISTSMRQRNTISFNERDIKLLDLLANGLTQDEISKKFKHGGIMPSSRSSIEKRLQELKEVFDAKTTTHLIIILKDLKVI